jgi:hypothetical protein
MKRLSKLVPFVFVGVLLVLALLPAGAPANPPAATISFVGGGTLLSPVSVEVTLHYSCLPPSPGEIDAAIDESGMAFGTSNPEMAICDGKNHSVTLDMVGGPAFTPGIATGTASVFNNAGAIADANEQIIIK